jgi:hypothetical protein
MPKDYFKVYQVGQKMQKKNDQKVVFLKSKNYLILASLKITC